MAALSSGTLYSGHVAGRAGAWWSLALLGLIGALHGVWLVGPMLWSADAPFWKSPPGDIAVGVIGLEAFLRDAWHWPLAATGRLLADGKPISIAYTDSLPLLAIALKILGVEASALPPFGLAIFLGQVLQPIAAGWALRRAGLSHWAVIVPGALLLACAPFWLFRLLLQHLALTWHWQILLALGLSLGWCRAGRIALGGVIGALALCAVASATHAYLAFQVVAVLLSGCLVLVADKRAPAAVALAVGLVGAAILGAAIVGLLPPPKAGLTIGPLITKPGHHSLNLLGPFDFSYSDIWRASRSIDATHGQYEGMAYVGTGTLLLLTLAAIGAARRFLVSRRTGPLDRINEGTDDLRRYWPIAIVVGGLLPIALFPDLWVGNERIVSLPVPEITATFWEQFRSNGRFAWPLLYLLVILALVASVQLMGVRAASVAITVALGVQVLDVALLRQEIRTMLAKPPAVLPEESLASLVANAPMHDVRFRPSWACLTFQGSALVRPLALEMARAGAVVHQPPLARGATGDCDRSRIASDKPLAGVTDVILRGSLSRANLVELLRRRDCTVGKDLLVCRDERPAALPLADALAQLFPGQSVQPGVRYPIALGQPGADWLYEGWSGPEPWGTWTDGPLAVLWLPLPTQPHAGALRLELTAFSAAPSQPQPLTVMMGDKTLWQGELVAGQVRTIRVAVDPNARSSGSVVLTLRIGRPHSPAGAGISNDTRLLGIGLLSVEWEGG